MDAGRPGQPRGDIWTDLVSSIIDSRTEEATRRFDADIAAAVAVGEISEQTSQRLQGWQRASIRELADHVRTVLPATLRAVDSAREDALAHAEELAGEIVGTATESSAPFPDAPATTTKPAARAPEAPRQPTGGAARPAQARGDVRRASPAQSGQPRTLEERRPRLLVADLTDTRKDRTN